VWSRGSSGRRRQPDALAALLTADEQQQSRQLCGRVLYHTLSSSVRVYSASAHHAFVATGDIADEWIRDSSVQLGVYLPRIAAHPSLRQVGACWSRTLSVLQRLGC
jgi:meiotically up-regulated gene 157 (Mug157) protein